MSDRYEVNAQGILAKEILLAALHGGHLTAPGAVPLSTWACDQAAAMFRSLEERGWMVKVLNPG